ncbi:MAG: PD-(D/E)XK nuclease family protein [Termitinemataceae bacterium]|nr:MAG: PD-(D/E)XK nuclease family protein [Termitinemataceae bacterium]
MKITFGMYLDGASWSNKKTLLGEVCVGPMGALQLLETHLGLSGIRSNQVERINEYFERIKKDDNSKRWYHESFEADPWSTSAQLLEWRDVLVAGGWDGKIFQGVEKMPRLKTLSDLEAIKNPLSDGVGERLQNVLKALKEDGATPITEIVLLEHRAQLPPIWQKIWNCVQKQGVTITENNKSLSVNKNSILLLEAEDEWQAAETISLWLSAKTEKDNEDVLMITSGGTEILDTMLHKLGLPQFGISVSSRWREVFQVLPLVLANAWKPVDIQRFAELLSLSINVVPYSSWLLETISKEPGLGGEAWGKTLESIKKNSKENGKDDGEEIVAELESLFNTERCSPEPGMSEDALIKRCEWVAKRLEKLKWKYKNDNEVLFLFDEAILQAKRIQGLAAGKKMMSRTFIERMLDSVIGGGSSDPSSVQHAAPWTNVSHPGAITSCVQTIIWWGFCDSGSGHAGYWDPDEMEVLEKSKIDLEVNFMRRRRETDAWQRAVMFANKKVIFVHPKRKDGEELHLHPFWDVISAECEKLKIDTKKITQNCSELCADGQWNLAGRSLTLDTVKRAKKGPPPLTSYRITSNSIALPKNTSFTQISNFIGCPMKWVLEKHVKIKEGDSVGLTSGGKMIGNLCHKIVEKLYTSNPSIDAKSAALKAAKLYDELLPSMASELLMEGRELEIKRNKNTVVDSVRFLVENTTRLGLTFVEAEKSLNRVLETSFGKITFNGKADLIFKTATDEDFIIDLKWGNPQKYKDKIENGESVQLAAYKWLLKSKKSNSGYFMLTNSEFLSDSTILEKDALVSPRNLTQIWEATKRTWESDFKNLTNGTLEVKGVKEKLRAVAEKQDAIYIEPPCKYCSYQILCGIDNVEGTEE